MGSEPRLNEDRRSHKTDAWFTDGQLANIASMYRGQFKTLPLSYATIRDFRDSLDYLHPIATAGEDLKDSRRPWVPKAILCLVPPCSRVLEIGDGEPFVADILDRLGYAVWIVDPFDRSAHGPLDYEMPGTECPGVRFVRGVFGEQVLQAPPGGFDCIFSISVLERVPAEIREGIFAGMKKYLRPSGRSVHALHHMHKGSVDDERYTKLKSIVRKSGFEEIELTQLIASMDSDPETRYFSAESHNSLRGSLSSDEIRMSVCVSIQMASRAVHLRV